MGSAQATPPLHQVARPPWGPGGHCPAHQIFGIFLPRSQARDRGPEETHSKTLHSTTLHYTTGQEARQRPFLRASCAAENCASLLGATGGSQALDSRPWSGDTSAGDSWFEQLVYNFKKLKKLSLSNCQIA